MKTKINDVKKLFIKLGTCSRTYCYLLNREFDNHKEPEERATDPLAGGIYKQGYQCGMLWGASLAAGAEAFRRFDDREKAIGVAIKSTQHIMESFKKRTNSIECYEITTCDWSSKLSMAKHFFSGKFVSCFSLAQEWAPEAIQSAREGLSNEHNDLPPVPMSCASEVVKKMGASDEEMVMVAGFAGGLGLCGNACGALSAAIWMKTLNWCRKNKKSAFSSKEAEETIEKFYSETDYEMLCNNISAKCFKSVEDHTEFIKDGGCDKLINSLAQF
jgi:Putative redox-active protein (C_GCAxxG_C_C)